MLSMPLLERKMFFDSSYLQLRKTRAVFCSFFRALIVHLLNMKHFMAPMLIGYFVQGCMAGLFWLNPNQEKRNCNQMERAVGLPLVAKRQV